jgi:Ring finger domain
MPGNGIPPNAITLHQLPGDFNLIALIPISQCTNDYLLQAKYDQAEAALVYNYTSSTDMSSSPLTTIGSFNNPVYGISAAEADPLVRNMINYAGNMSTVPFGRNLSAVYDPADYVRLTLTIDTGQTSSLPGLWLFLLVILAALGLIIASTSVSMHLSQYRARRDLRRRIAAGEIDLESLGIKRLTVPREMVDTMSIKIYGASSTSIPPSRDRNSSSGASDSRIESISTSPFDSSEKSISHLKEAPSAGFELSTCCAICLDDYVADVTPVRQLPCKHIFHPHCIDPFLQSRSSLCPLCKRSVLPKGFIPPTLTLTNATVARERRIRLMRERASTASSTREEPTGSENDASGIEMTSPTVGEGNDLGAPTQEEEDEELRRRPLTRRILESVFPYFTRPAGGAIRSIRRRTSQLRGVEHVR